MSNIAVLKNGLVYTKDNRFEPLCVQYDDSGITMVSPEHDPDAEIIDCTGCYVLPGLTDIHFHGCAGHDFCDSSLDALKAMAEYEFSRGVTSICPAAMTLPDDRLEGIIDNAVAFSKAGTVKNAAELIGINLEGPFISGAKKGAHKEEYIAAPSPEKIRRWHEISDGLLKLVTIAPEVEGALECIGSCGDILHFSLGHTDCTYDTAASAFKLGADHVTHLYNAMPPLLHREPGLIGAAFDDGKCFVELICDGIHVSPAAVRAAFKLFGDGRVALISDSMEATGMPDGRYTLGGQSVTKCGNRATLSDGTLAGSVTDLYGCMLKAVEIGIPLESAVRAATIVPCRSIGADGRYGSIEVGKAAHFLILDTRDLSIKKVIK